MYLPNSKRTMRFNPSPAMRELRGNCTGPFPVEMANQTGVPVDIDGVVSMSGRQVMAGADLIEGASFVTCPNVYIDPLSPEYRGAPWLNEAAEVADALGLELRLSDFAPDATGPMRELVQHIIAERRRRSIQ